MSQVKLLDQPLPDSVRLVIVGGEEISRRAYEQWLQDIGARCQWLNVYGPTEELQLRRQSMLSFPFVDQLAHLVYAN